jgi:hypothetical protein
MRNRRFLTAGLLVVTAVVSFAAWRTGPASGTQGHLRKLTVYGWDVNTRADELIPAPGTRPGVVSLGDIHIVNDYLTTEPEHALAAIGFTSGSCTVTNVPQARRPVPGHGLLPPFNATYMNCALTVTLPHGSLVAQGVAKPIPLTGAAPFPRGTLAVTGGTGIYAGAKGTVALTWSLATVYNFQLQ